MPNAPARALGDWNDIYRLVIQAATGNHPLHWDLIADYLSIFGLEARLGELKALYENNH